jgi:triacylglycerol lipase
MNEVQFLINVMYPAAQAAYSIMNGPSTPLTLPAGYTLVSAINADSQQAAPAMALANPDQQRLANQTVLESSIFGLVAWSATDQTALIALRGTKTLVEWLADVDAPAIPYLPDPASGCAHMGFLLVYQHIRNSIQTLLTAKCSTAKRILITGHSLGGALAMLCGLDVVKNSTVRVVPELHTFAGPRTGDPKLAGIFDAAIPICNRVVNFLDVVPQVPVPPVYQHVGKELLVHGGFRPLDISYAHHITTYLAGLQKLPAAPGTS